MEMETMRIIAGIYLLIAGVANQVIDYKHRKRNAYEPGCAWQYYSQLAREGSREAKIMMWSGYIAIYFIIAILGVTFYELAKG